MGGGTGKVAVPLVAISGMGGGMADARGGNSATGAGEWAAARVGAAAA
jgi:hypothetical protein